MDEQSRSLGIDAGLMRVVIVVPVLARPHRVAPLIASVERATKDYRLLFVANESDTAEIEELQHCRADHIVVPDSRISWACKINDGFRATTEEWIFTGADDLHFHPDWFPRALRWAEDGYHVIGTNDICNPRVMTGEHATHALFRRSYVEQFGTIERPGLVMHEEYRHDHADDEAIGTAKARGVYVHAFDSIVEHLHPMRGKSEDDDTYRLGRKFSQAGRQLFRKRSPLWANHERVRAAMVPAPPKAVVVTASYGGYDATLHVPAEQDMAVDFICVTDDATNITAPHPWRVIVQEARWPDNPRMSAKVPKCTPDSALLGCEDVIWIDASHEITSPSFAREALAARKSGIAAFTHPRRDCVFDELDALLGSENQNGLYFHRPLEEQKSAYRAEGHPEHAGLYACGTVAWDLRDPRVLQFGQMWLEETLKWSHQDQCEFPVVARRLGLSPGFFPVPQIDAKLSRGVKGFANPWLKILPHKKTPIIPPVSVLIPFESQDGHRQHNLQWVCDWYSRVLPKAEIVVGSCVPDGPWSKGAALRDAYKDAKHDILVIADADCYVDIDALRVSIEAVASGAAKWASPHARVIRIDQRNSKRILNGDLAPMRAPRNNVKRAPMGGGIVVLSREAWEMVNGIDPRFFGWGGEDISFGWALETLCGRRQHGDATLWHLWHEPAHGPDRRGTAESEALAGRYRRARGDVQEMLALTTETLADA